MKNFMNSNDIFPILDIIDRRMRQKAGHKLSGVGGYADQTEVYANDSAGWQVESFEVERDTANPIDPQVIKEVVIIYRNGAVENIKLGRGLTPTVPDTVPDSEYINNLMITEVTIRTAFDGDVSEVTARIFRENGYGNFQRVELDYGE